MIHSYVKHLMSNLPKTSVIPKKINLVLSGGAFNGSYMLGSLYYLKELENLKKLKIKKISGSSIGSILGLLYIADKLDLFVDLYKSYFDDFVKNKNLSKLLNFKNIIKDELPKNICDLVNKRFYMTFHNLQSGKKEIKHTYKNVDELLDCIIRSCYVPFLIDYSPAYKNKYIDGVLPYFFKERTNRKVLYINVLTHDKYKHILNIKNETTNLHRVLSGMNDIHLFFIKNKNTQMCSYTDRWSIYEYFVYTLIRIIEISCFYTMCIIKDITCTETFNHIIKNVITTLFIKLSLI